MNRFDMFDLSVEENRRAFRMAIETSDSDAIAFIAALATRLEIHRACSAMSPGLFVQRNDANDEPGTIVGICGGRRFLISDSDVAWTVWQWRRLERSDFVASAKSRRALALLVIADDAYSAHDADTIALQNDSSVGGLAIATRTILRCMELRDELARTQSALDSCYETIHAARIRIHPFEYNPENDGLNWEPGVRGRTCSEEDAERMQAYGFYPPSRLWCDRELVKLGYVLPDRTPCKGYGCDNFAEPEPSGAEFGFCESCQAHDEG